MDIIANIGKMFTSKSENCPKCGNSFGIFRWKYDCTRCHTIVCADCLSSDVRGKRVCNDCHECWHCDHIGNKSDLKTVLKYPLCPKCCEKLEKTEWISGTKREDVKGCVIKRTGAKKIVVSARCEDPAEVEEHLKVLAILHGFNGYIKFFWEKHCDVTYEKVQAGTSRNGNPYYKTVRHSYVYYTGYAFGVELIRK